MNGIFEKNISALKKRFPTLAENLLRYIPSDIPQLVQENNFFNLQYKNTCLHNPVNPLGEAIEIFSQIQNTPVAIHLVYGLGLGYLFQYTAQNSKGSVILYEPDLNILRISFSLVDFSKELLCENVFITTDKQEIISFLHTKSNTKNSPYLISTTNYRELNRESFDNLVEELKRIVGSNSLDLKYTQQKMYPLLKTVISNINTLKNETPLINLKDIYKGKTALVVSAGPTLDRNIATMKKYRDNYILIVVGTAVKTLLRNDITPDFITIIESYDSSPQVEGVDFANINFVTEPFSNYNPRNLGWKNIFSHSSENMAVNKLWAELSEQNIDEYSSKGSVSYTALNIARILGCSKIVLVGQDLAYIEGQCYSKDSAYKDLICTYNQSTERWEITAKDINEFAKLSSAKTEEERLKAVQERLKNLNNSLYYVKGIQGDLLPTESVYAAFIKPLSDFTKQYNDRTFINTSLVGALIEGYQNITLEEAIKDDEPIESRDIRISKPVSDEIIKKNLSNHLDEITFALNKIEEGQKLIKSCNNEIKRYKTLNESILKSLKKLTVHYLEMSSEYSSKNKIYDIATMSDKIDLDYEMKMIQTLDFDSVVNIISKISGYYNNAQIKLKELIPLISNVLEGLK